MKKIILLIVLVALGFFGYKYYQKMNTEVEPTSEIQNEVDAEEVIDMHKSEDVLDYTGLYQGNLPCGKTKDCSSIFTTLEITKEGTYKLSEQIRKTQEVSDYYKNKEGLTQQEGKYTLENGELTLVLKDGSKRTYKLGENTLTQGENVLNKFLN